EVWYSAPNATVKVVTYEPSQGWVTRGVVTGVTFAAGERFGARATADGGVQVFRDATLLGSVDVGDWPFAGAVARIGLSFTSASAGRWDDFGGGDMDLGVGSYPVVHLAAPAGGESWTGGNADPLFWTPDRDRRGTRGPCVTP